MCSQYATILTLSFFCSCLSRTLFKCHLFIHATTNYLTPTMVLGAREIKMLFDISIGMSKGILNIVETVPLMFITQCDSPPLFLAQEMALVTPLSHPGQNPKSQLLGEKIFRKNSLLLFLSNSLVLLPKYIYIESINFSPSIPVLLNKTFCNDRNVLHFLCPIR